MIYIPVTICSFPNPFQRWHYSDDGLVAANGMPFPTSKGRDMIRDLVFGVTAHLWAVTNRGTVTMDQSIPRALYPTETGFYEGFDENKMLILVDLDGKARAASVNSPWISPYRLPGVSKYLSPVVGSIPYEMVAGVWRIKSF